MKKNLGLIAFVASASFLFQGCSESESPVSSPSGPDKREIHDGLAGVDSYATRAIQGGIGLAAKPFQPETKPEIGEEAAGVGMVEWPAEAFAKGAAYTNWVQNLSVTTTTSCPALQGRINVDLNKGAGGKYIYLCYGKDDGIADSWGPIKNIRVYGTEGGAPSGMSTEGCAQINLNNGDCIGKFIKAVNGSNGDFNQGSGGGDGWYVMMYKRYTNIYPDIQNKRVGSTGENWPTQVRLNDLAIIYGGNSGISCPSGYLKDLTDLNYGVGGSFIYLCEKFASFAY